MHLIKMVMNLMFNSEIEFMKWCLAFEIVMYSRSAKDKEVCFGICFGQVFWQQSLFITNKGLVELIQKQDVLGEIPPYL